ncbi:hypothetical protein GGTG_12280 [Gaeumannomyces tritici R3-111a-1]|uniref:Uncharacterized protein n=1 Tax=Gaeumannomyces tritici (strain R3-111a-1) TaxID=644352 RepID=J3PFK5_GAET3|nr:hypothetical protein GGTG_12280 [Gaeumannomyces tritici R3-111a-1]EJT70107.1 hypothetical protein GGTG_12280 [Gaeumannomyces tritici R3-111a-1]
MSIGYSAATTATEDYLKGESVLWLDGRDGTKPRGSIAQHLARIPISPIPEADRHTYAAAIRATPDPSAAVQCFKIWLSLTGNTRWLLVFDNNVDKEHRRPSGSLGEEGGPAHHTQKQGADKGAYDLASYIDIDQGGTRWPRGPRAIGTPRPSGRLGGMSFRAIKEENKDAAMLLQLWVRCQPAGHVLGACWSTQHRFKHRRTGGSPWVARLAHSSFAFKDTMEILLRYSMGLQERARG